MLGDNRDNSLDSRYWGFVPDSLVRGRPMIVYYSYAPDTNAAFAWITRVRWQRLGQARSLTLPSRSYAPHIQAWFRDRIPTQEREHVWQACPRSATRTTKARSTSTCVTSASIPLITREEEVELAQRIRVGDQEALDKLVRSQPAVRRVGREEVPEPGRVAVAT